MLDQHKHFQSFKTVQLRRCENENLLPDHHWHCYWSILLNAHKLPNSVHIPHIIYIFWCASLLLKIKMTSDRSWKHSEDCEQYLFPGHTRTRLAFQEKKKKKKAALKPATPLSNTHTHTYTTPVRNMLPASAAEASTLAPFTVLCRSSVFSFQG